MKCPSCAIEMTRLRLEGRLSPPVELDLCAACQAFWFDKFESLRLSPGSTLKLMKFIGEHSSERKPAIPAVLRCPQCRSHLRLTHDMQRSTRFTYWRCDKEHGKFIGFFDFLREKNFICPLSPKQLNELRQNVQFVHCSNCGASIDLTTGSICAYCRSPVSMLDMQQPQQMLQQLQEAAEPRPIDPALPLELARVKLELDRRFGPDTADPQWWSDVRSAGLVQAGLGAVARWLTQMGGVSLAYSK